MPIEASDSGVVRFSGFAVEPNGRFYLADASQSRVFAYERDGTQRLTLGRRGEGPGELLNPRFLSFIGDTLWVGQNNGRVSVFVDDTFHSEFRLDSASFISSLARTSSGFVGTRLPGKEGAVAWWDGEGNFVASALPFGEPPAPAEPDHPFWASLTQYMAVWTGPWPDAPGTLVVATISDSVWRVDPQVRSAISVRAEGHNSPGLPPEGYRPTDLPDYLAEVDLMAAPIASDRLVGVHISRGYLYLGAPHRLALRFRDEPLWRVLAGGPPMLGALADTLYGLISANDSGGPVALGKFVRKAQ